MPNHVTHQITCTGPVEDVAAFKQLMVVEGITERPSYFPKDKPFEPQPTVDFDFNRIIPMPPILEQMHSPSKLGPNGRAMLYDYSKGGFQTSTEGREATVEEQAQIDAAGGLDWYSWSINNWGTKWNSYAFNEGENHARYGFSFDTAWSPPEPVFDKLVEKFPNLTFDVAWFDEGWMHAGEGVIGRDNPDSTMDTIACEPNDELYEKVYGSPPIDWDEEEYQMELLETERRMSENFTCRGVSFASDKDGYFEVRATLFSTDPECPEDYLFEIRRAQTLTLERATAAFRKENA